MGSAQEVGAGALQTKASSVPCRASPLAPSPPHPLPALSASQGWLVGSRRALQHSNLLQCLAQCAEVTPYLLVMEFCPMVSSPLPPVPALRFWKTGLASCRGALAEPGTPQPHPVGLTSPPKWGPGGPVPLPSRAGLGEEGGDPTAIETAAVRAGPPWCPGWGWGQLCPLCCLCCLESRRFSQGAPRPAWGAQSPHVWSTASLIL